VRGLSSAIQELLKSQDKVDKVGFADLRNTPDSLLQALREYFGPKKDLLEKILNYKENIDDKKRRAEARANEKREQQMKKQK
jgi:hypothetical protein